MTAAAVNETGILSVGESSRLVHLEGVIERGLATFVEVGEALMEIRDSRLYRRLNSTFEDYCRERWGFSKTHANRLVQGAEVAALVTPLGVGPANERQARELTPLLDKPAELREAWQEASTNGAPTAARVREAVATRMGVHYSSDTDEWATPPGLFDEFNAKFSFTVDVCATEANAKCEQFFSPKQDGLRQEWTGTCWMNPPYGSEIKAWVRKAWESAQAGATVACLVPARVDTAWWWDYCRFGKSWVLRGRIKFGGGETAAPFPSALVVFDAECEKGVERPISYWGHHEN